MTGIRRWTKLAALIFAPFLLGACQTASGIERDTYHSVPVDLLRLQLDRQFQETVVKAGEVDAFVNWVTSKSASPYYENLTVRGADYEINVNLRMLPKGWHWTVQESTHDLRKDLQAIYHRFLPVNLSLGSHIDIPTNFMRSFYARFEMNGRSCAGAMIATVPGVLPNQFRNTVISYICVARGSNARLDRRVIQQFFDAISITDPYYNGGGFSSEQVEFLKGLLTGTA